MTSELEKVATALMNAEALNEAKERIHLLEEKTQSEIQAIEAVYILLSRWLDTDIQVGEAIPVKRENAIVALLPPSPFGLVWQCPAPPEVEDIVRAARQESTKELKAKHRTFEKLQSSLLEVIHDLQNLTLEEQSALIVQVKSSDRAKIALEEKIIEDIGPVFSTVIAATKLHETVGRMTRALSERIAERPTGKGRPRNEAAYQVALALGKLYAKVTGDRPTYSEDADGLHGDFTPALRTVFDILGSSWNDLSGPANYARDAITEDDLTPPTIPTFGGFLGLGKPVQ